MASAVKRTSGGGSLMWLLGLGCGLAAVFAGPMAALLAVLALPAVVTWFADTTPGRAVPRIVLVAALAMALRPLVRLLGAGVSWGPALAMLTDVEVLAGAWAVQAAAWLAGELAPLVARLILDLAAAAQIARLRAARERLVTDWGPPPA